MTTTIEETDDLKARYQRAQILMQGIYSQKLVRNTTVFPIWIDETDCFWYERDTKVDVAGVYKYGKEYRLINAELGTNEMAFDHKALAKSLNTAIGQSIDHFNLPIAKVKMTLDSPNSGVRTVGEVYFDAFDSRWVFDTAGLICKSIETFGSNEHISPDGKKVVFRRGFNLWLRDLYSGEERALTRDGEEFYVYGATGAAWGFEQDMDQTPQAIWSPDSKQIFTVQRDTRQVRTLPTVQHIPDDGSMRPIVKYSKVAYPGDAHVDSLRLLAINCETSQIQSANYRNIPITRNSFGFFFSNLGWWENDGHYAYFVDVERDYRTARVVEFDTYSGATRILFEEKSETHINLMLNQDELPIFVPLPESKEVLWFSERSGWGHLYLYDLESGELKNIVTQGDWLVRDIVHIDNFRREVFVQTAGRVKNRDIYYRDLCRINLDTGSITTLVSSDHEYWAVTKKNLNTFLAVGFGRDATAASSLSPTGNFAAITRSRADEAPVSLLLDRHGKQVLEIEAADLSDLPGGWRWPEPVKLLAADNLTDIYGLIYRPSDFSPQNSYPIVSHVFNTPEVPWVPKGSFSNGTVLGGPYLDAAALAELGFIVVQFDGRGMPGREKGFHDESYGQAESAGDLNDHIAGIKQLAKRFSYIDLDRVGITSHCSGGPGPAHALLQHPEFFKVGVNGMYTDSRLVSAPMWGEKFNGLSHQVGKAKYPEELAQNLQGKLLLMHGMLDTCCAPAGVFRLIEALQKANKDFDLLLLPSMAHEFSSYLTRRSWDYLVRHLLDGDPPKEFKLTTELDTIMDATLALR